LGVDIRTIDFWGFHHRSTFTRLAREGGGLEGIWLEPSDTVLMVRRILSAEAGARPRMSCSAGFVRHKNRRGQIGPMSSAMAKPKRAALYVRVSTDHQSVVSL
jgi:hypothetical protein